MPAPKGKEISRIASRFEKRDKVDEIIRNRKASAHWESVAARLAKDEGKKSERGISELPKELVKVSKTRKGAEPEKKDEVNVDRAKVSDASEKRAESGGKSEALDDQTEVLQLPGKTVESNKNSQVPKGHDEAADAPQKADTIPAITPLFEQETLHSTPGEKEVVELPQNSVAASRDLDQKPASSLPQKKQAEEKPPNLSTTDSATYGTQNKRSMLVSTSQSRAPTPAPAITITTTPSLPRSAPLPPQQKPHHFPTPTTYPMDPPLPRKPTSIKSNQQNAKNPQQKYCKPQFTPTPSLSANTRSHPWGPSGPPPTISLPYLPPKIAAAAKRAHEMEKALNRQLRNEEGAKGLKREESEYEFLFVDDDGDGR